MFFFLIFSLIFWHASVSSTYHPGQPVRRRRRPSYFRIFFVLGWRVVDGGRQKKFLADMELDMVADKEVDKLADMVAGYRC